MGADSCKKLSHTMVAFYFEKFKSKWLWNQHWAVGKSAYGYNFTNSNPNRHMLLGG